MKKIKNIHQPVLPTQQLFTHKILFQVNLSSSKITSNFVLKSTMINT